MNRHLMRTLARFLAGIMLLAQLMVAAHACVVPASLATDVQPLAAASAEYSRALAPSAEALSPDCDSMAIADNGSLWTNLCAEHCKMGDQSDRGGPELQWSVASPGLWYLHQPAVAVSYTRRTHLLRVDSLAATQPPHAILHCVRRT